MSIILDILYLCYVLFFLIASSALIFRRLHDSGMSGWWYGIPSILVVIFTIIFYSLGLNPDLISSPGFLNNLQGFAKLIYSILIISIIGFLIVFIMMFFKSQKTKNVWGESPTNSFEFLEASKKYFTNWLDFKTRSRRSEYWWTWITLLIISILEYLFVAIFFDDIV